MTDDKVAVELAELKGAINIFMQNWQKQDDRAAASRQELHQKMTTLQVAQAGIMRDLADVVNDVAEIRPKVEKLDSAYNVGRGAVLAIKVGRVVFWGVLVVAGWFVAHFLEKGVSR